MKSLPRAKSRGRKTKPGASKWNNLKKRVKRAAERSPQRKLWGKSGMETQARDAGARIISRGTVHRTAFLAPTSRADVSFLPFPRLAPWATFCRALRALVAVFWESRAFRMADAGFAKGGDLSNATVPHICPGLADVGLSANAHIWPTAADVGHPRSFQPSLGSFYPLFFSATPLRSSRDSVPAVAAAKLPVRETTTKPSRQRRMNLARRFIAGYRTTNHRSPVRDD